MDKENKTTGIIGHRGWLVLAQFVDPEGKANNTSCFAWKYLYPTMFPFKKVHGFNIIYDEYLKSLGDIYYNKKTREASTAVIGILAIFAENITNDIMNSKKKKQEALVNIDTKKIYLLFDKNDLTWKYLWR